MEKNLELIWKKIDGSLSKDEAINFNQLIHDDKSFAILYKAQVNLNTNLKNIPSVAAPSSLVSNIIQNITQKKVVYSKEYSSFGGMKIIALASIITLILVVLITMTINLSFDASAYPELTSWLNRLSMPISLQGMESYTTYLLVLLPGIVLIWLDNMFRREPIQIKVVR
jgi:hypothetical protein